MISNKIVEWMIYQKVISLEERKLYLYALQSFYFSIAPFILAILIGSVMKQFLNGVFLGITISIVRKYSGGYHAKKVWICHFFSVVILIGCFILFSYIQIRFVFFVFETGAVISLSILSPIQSTDHTLDQSEKTKYKKVTAILAIGCEIFEIILAIFGKEYIAKTIGTGIMVVALLQWPCILKIK